MKAFSSHPRNTFAMRHNEVSPHARTDDYGPQLKYCLRGNHTPLGRLKVRENICMDIMTTIQSLKCLHVCTRRTRMSLDIAINPV